MNCIEIWYVIFVEGKKEKFGKKKVVFGEESFLDDFIEEDLDNIEVEDLEGEIDMVIYIFVLNIK